MPVTITAEDLVTRRVLPPLAVHLADLRGAPVSETAELWEADLPPADGQPARRVRIMRSDLGWWSRGGSPEKPAALEGCDSMLDRSRWRAPSGEFDQAACLAFHQEHPVVWAVEVRTDSEARCEAWCDAEMPEEWRPIVTP